MELLSFIWLLGETLSIAALLAGAGLTVFAKEPFFCWYLERTSTRIPAPEAHEPLNHRLLLEAEW